MADKRAIRGCISFYLIAAFMFLMTFPAQVHAMPAEAGAPGPLEILGRMEPAYAKVDDYTATFLKKERVKGEVLPEETIFLKFKKPFKVYMKWLPGPHKGRESLYVQGRYDDKVIGHEGGILSFITLRMDPSGGMAMKGNRHPITDVGIGRLIEIIMTNVRRAGKEGVLETGPVGEGEVYGRKTYNINIKFDAGKEKGYYCKDINLWVDRELYLPVKIAVYGWDGEFLEGYGYKDLKINPGLKDEEFDRDYKGYGF
jgi:outer membrane lipoprotein-sorting protein